MESKLKILALHGYRQSGKTFRSKIGSFRKIVNKYAEFTFITAPHKVLNDVGVLCDQETHLHEDGDGEEYGWWFDKADVTFKGNRVDEGGNQLALGFEASRALVEKTYNEQGPFDGILGFSQGGCLAGLILSMQEQEIIQTNFQFGIVVSGFKSGTLPHFNHYADVLDVPTMHVYETGDEIIPQHMSLALAEMFNTDKSVVVSHSGGHFFPASKDQKEHYIEFVRDMLIMKLEEEEIAKAIDDNVILVKDKI